MGCERVVLGSPAGCGVEGQVCDLVLLSKHRLQKTRAMCKGTLDITLRSQVACGLWPGEKCWGGEHSALGLDCTQRLTVRGLKREEGPQNPLPPFQRPPPPCSWQSARPELPRRGLSPARAEPNLSTCQNSCLGARACAAHAPASASRGLTACLALRPPFPSLLTFY